MPIDSVAEFIAGIKTDLEHFYVDLWKNHMRDEPRHLFHYTSSEGLLGIVRSRKLYLSDMFASTDQSEIRHGIDLVRGVLEETPSDPISKSFREAFDKTGMWWGIGNRFFVHAICFCCGDDVLTQWRGFAPSAGVAIGVDFAALKNRAENSEFALGRMLYDTNKQRDLVQRTLARGRQYFPRLKAIFGSVPESAAKLALDTLMTEVGICLLKSLLLFKHSAFHSEDEWRVFKLEAPDTLSQALNFRARGGSIIPYVELPFEPSLVSHVRCSPGPWSQSSLYGIDRLAKSLGDHVQVTQSTIPL